MRKCKSSDLLIEVELEFMIEFWKFGEGFVWDIFVCLLLERKIVYMFCVIIMWILDDKGFVDSCKEGKIFIYFLWLIKDIY